MSRCYDCGSYDADPDIGLCFECFCRSRPSEPEEVGPTTEEFCAAYGHPLFDDGAERCYCGAVRYPQEEKTP